MKLKVNKDLIDKIIMRMQQFLEKRDATQITSHIYIEAIGDTTIIKATDMEIGLEIKTKDFEIIQEGRVTANGKKLLDIIKILKNDTIILEHIEDYI